MTRKLMTVDEFRNAADEGRLDGTVVRLATGDPEIIGEADSRTLRFVFSDATVDRAGDSIDPAGWQTKTFEANPVALWAHNSSAPPIGRAFNVAPSKSKLFGDIEFMSRDISEFADSIYRMYKAKFLRAVSVGFMPLEWKFVSTEKRPFGIDFLKQELLEISACPVPCNPNALQEAKSAGIDIGPLREWASKVLDEGGHILVPRNVLEETFRQAKTPRTVRQKYLAQSETPDWKMGALGDLPTDDVDAWDGAAAAKRMLDAAGFDGDAPDPATAKTGFLLHDAANPLLRSSYKLPFADIVDGELKAIKAGVIAAKGRLDQTDAPLEVLEEADATIAAYEKSGWIVPKAGRRISSANEAKLKQAMDHHASATNCIKDVLESIKPDADDPDADGDDDQGSDKSVEPDPVVVPPVDERAARIAAAKALRESLKL